MSLGGARPRLPRARHHGNGTQDLFSLQAATLRAAVFYERLGFRRMRAEDVPLALVPPGDAGWSPEILRVAAGRPGPRERAMPWLVLEPSRGFAAQPRFTASARSPGGPGREAPGRGPARAPPACAPAGALRGSSS